MATNNFTSSVLKGGMDVEAFTTSEDCIKNTGLDWTVRKEALLAHLVNGKDVPVYRRFVIVRDDNDFVLGVVRKNFQAVQNIDGFGLVDAIRQQEGDTIFSRAGEIALGERIYIVAKLPGEIRIKDSSDIVDKNFMMFNAHTGMASLTMGFTPTFRTTGAVMSLGRRDITDRFSVRHTRGMDQRLKEATKVLKIADNYFASLGQMFDALADVRINSDKLTEILDRAMPFPAATKEGEEPPVRIKNIREKVQSLYEDTKVDPKLVGTGWALYQAFAEFSDFHKSFKDSRGDGTSQDDNRLVSVFEGDSYDLKNQVADIILS